MSAHDSNTGLAILKVAASVPDKVAIRDGASSVTYGQLAELTIRLAARLMDVGITQGKTVAARSDDTAFVLASVYATALVGARWVYAFEDLVRSRRLDIDLVLDAMPHETGLLPGAVRVDAAWFAAASPRDAAPRFPGFRVPGETWLLTQTSGTTGTPKLIALSHLTMSRRLAANGARFDWSGLVTASLFPDSSMLATVYQTTTLLNRGEVVTGRNVGVWNECGVGFAYGSPAQAKTVLGERVLERRIPWLQLSGGPASDELVAQLLKSFERVVVGYGSTESFNVFGTEKTLGPGGEVLSSPTTIRAGVTVEVVDENDEPVPAGTEGFVRITNDHLASGYLNAPEAEAAVFRDGWFYPGDLGCWSDTGEFRITGRTNDQFNLGGTKINAQLLDFTLLSVPGVTDAMCFMMPGSDGTDGLRAFLSITPEADPTEVMALARVAMIQVGGASAVPKRILFADSLPRNANGKADRRACAAMIDKVRADRRS